MIRFLTTMVVALAASMAVSGCGGSDPEPDTPPANEGENAGGNEGTNGGADPVTPPVDEPAANAEAVAAAELKFNTLCAACHGADGTGDTPTAAALDPKPRNYTSVEWQDSVTDAEITEIILKGGAAVGKSLVMPASLDLADQPEVVAELVKIIRAFRP